MKKTITLIVLSGFICFLSVQAFAATAQEKIDKLQSEITALQSKLSNTKNKTQIARMNKTIKGHQAKIEELKKELPADSQLKLEITKVQIVEKSARSLTLKGGLAGGAALFAADYLMPMGPVFLGGEIGYAMGSGFGIIDAGAKVLYPIGNFNVGLELAYAGYSKDVTNVPGLSGVIKSGIGFGIVGGTKMGPVQVGLGYNTGLGLRVDAGYRYYL